MIATSQSLASSAGLGVLQRGGNAVDAAVTAAAVLAVVEPSMTGIGGDLLAILSDGRSGNVHALDSTGRSPFAATPDAFAARGLREMPDTGPLVVDVPGVVEGWHQLLRRFGTISLGDALEPAIRCARDGFPVAELMANEWSNQEMKLLGDRRASATFLPNGRPPVHGEVFANPRLARTLETIATRGRDAFYGGEIARAIVDDIKSRDGLLDLRDFEEHQSDWVDPIRTTYRGVELLEMPPSTQGFVALEMLNIFEGFDIRAMGLNSADYLHVVSEAKRIAFADRGAYLTDRDHMPRGSLERLISKSYAAERRAEIDVRRAHPGYTPADLGSRPALSEVEGLPTPDSRAVTREFAGSDRGDTVYLTAADGSGMVISLIQSLFGGFGAGFVAGETGITMQNRGSGFTLQAGHPNQVGPHKRPLHTLIPAMLLRDGKPWVSFGVMGGDNQAQAHAQIVANVVDFDMHVQQAGDAPRVRHMGDRLAVESGVSAEVRRSLAARGHIIEDGRGQVGGYKAIMIDSDSKVLLGGSDHRKDGIAIGF